MTYESLMTKMVSGYAWYIQHNMEWKASQILKYIKKHLDENCPPETQEMAEIPKALVEKYLFDKNELKAAHITGRMKERDCNFQSAKLDDQFIAAIIGSVDL